MLWMNCIHNPELIDFASWSGTNFWPIKINTLAEACGLKYKQLQINVMQIAQRALGSVSVLNAQSQSAWGNQAIFRWKRRALMNNISTSALSKQGTSCEDFAAQSSWSGSCFLQSIEWGKHNYNMMQCDRNLYFKTNATVLCFPQHSTLTLLRERRMWCTPVHGQHTNGWMSVRDHNAFRTSGWQPNPQMVSASGPQRLMQLVHWMSGCDDLSCQNLQTCWCRYHLWHNNTL